MSKGLKHIDLQSLLSLFETKLRINKIKVVIQKGQNVEER